jgi:hypothetical protein
MGGARWRCTYLQAGQHEFSGYFGHKTSIFRQRTNQSFIMESQSLVGMGYRVLEGMEEGSHEASRAGHASLSTGPESAWKRKIQIYIYN